MGRQVEADEHQAARREDAAHAALVIHHEDRNGEMDGAEQARQRVNSPSTKATPMASCRYTENGASSCGEGKP